MKNMVFKNEFFTVLEEGRNLIVERNNDEGTRAIFVPNLRMAIACENGEFDPDRHEPRRIVYLLARKPQD